MKPRGALFILEINGGELLREGALHSSLEGLATTQGSLPSLLIQVSFDYTQLTCRLTTMSNSAPVLPSTNDIFDELARPPGGLPCHPSC